MKERYDLARARIKEIIEESKGLDIYSPFFRKQSVFVSGLLDLYEDICEKGPIEGKSPEELKKRNDFLYEDIYENNYKTSYVNPNFCFEEFGNIGKYFCVLAAEMRGMIPFIFENQADEIVIKLELFLEVYGLVYGCVSEGTELKEEELHDIFYYYVFDYSEDEFVRRIAQQLVYNEDYATRVIEEYDWNEPSSLFAFGEYVGENEIKTLEAVAKLDEETVEIMARTYVDGFVRGFEVSKKDMTKKKTVNIRFRLGFEKVVQRAIELFEEAGLKPVIYRAGSDIFGRYGIYKPGYYGGLANPQFDEDHKEDLALVLDGHLVTRRIEGMISAYEKVTREACEWAGPACMEIFGEESFLPKDCEHAVKYGKDKQSLYNDYRVKSSKVQNDYIKREERSFTIIAWPTPAIGDNYDEILKGIVKVNTLDVELYKNIQQTIIDTLDESEYVHVKGMNGNRTDLKISLYELKDPSKETKFENCLSDVNIPLGEVFTSPVLKGTEGTLHVKKVFLNDLKFTDIELGIKDGKIVSYTCGNYEDEEKNKKFIETNLLFHHETLPMGEFAIGTNTFAYSLADRFNIGDKMPILIAEKMGPHFAFGDTCYSNEESVRVFNPDGKEMMAKENGEEYSYCHTDITIPYDELGSLCAVDKTGENTPIILEGKFVLEGTKKLNEALN